MAVSSKERATEIAKLVGGRVSKNPKHIIGEHPAEYRVTLHREPFWFTARISEDEFSFDANHCRGTGERGSFSITLYSPWANMGTNVLQEDLSESLGIEVYGINEGAGLLASPVLESPELRPFISRLRDEAYRIFFVHDTQLRATGSFTSSDDAAARMLMLRDMMETVYRVSRIVNPHFA
jgi:hypothetical protein